MEPGHEDREYLDQNAFARIYAACLNGARS